MNGFSVNWGLSPLTLRITQKCLYVRHLSVSPCSLFASDSRAVSVQHRGSLYLSGNVIHFRRQTVEHCGGEAWVAIMDVRPKGCWTGSSLCICLCILCLVASRWVCLFILQLFWLSGSLSYVLVKQTCSISLFLQKLWYLGGNMMQTHRPITTKFLCAAAELNAEKSVLSESTLVSDCSLR